MPVWTFSARIQQFTLCSFYHPECTSIVLFWLSVVEFVREEIVAILGMVFIAFFNQISMEVH